MGAGIHDKEFFPELPGLLSDVSGRLGRLMQLVERMEAATAAAAEAQAAADGGSASQGSLSSSMGTTEASEASLRAASSKKLKWADGQTTPPVEPAGQDSQEAAEGEEEGEDEQGEDGAVAADGERALRKGFRRRTWAGPAWLDAVTAGKVRRTWDAWVLCLLSMVVGQIQLILGSFIPPNCCPLACSRSLPRCASSWAPAARAPAPLVALR